MATSSSSQNQMSRRKQQVICILGMATVWPSLHNQLLYPITFSFHKEGASSPYLHYLLYSLILLVITIALMAASKQRLTSKVFMNPQVLVSLGLLGSLGITLLVICDFSEPSYSFFMGLGVSLAAAFVPVFFMFWSIQIVYISKRRASYDLAISYLVFAVVTAIRLAFGLHGWLFSICYPLISAALAIAALTFPQSNTFASCNTPLSDLPVAFIIPSIIFVYVGALSRALINPLSAAYDYPPTNARVVMYVALAVFMAVLALVYRPHSRLRKSMNLITFALVTILLAASILLTGFGTLGDYAAGNLPTIAGMNAIELFIWMLVLVSAQRRHSGIVIPAALYLIFVIGASHLLNVLLVASADNIQLDLQQLPVFAINLILAFLVTIIVNVALAAMLLTYKSAQDTVIARRMEAFESSRDLLAASADAWDGAVDESVSGPEAEPTPPCLSFINEEAAYAKVKETFHLSKREMDTLRLAVKNKSAKEMARSLFVAESTVNSHIKSLYRKCDVHSRQELIDLIAGFRKS